MDIINWLKAAGIRYALQHNANGQEAASCHDISQLRRVPLHQCGRMLIVGQSKPSPCKQQARPLFAAFYCGDNVLDFRALAAAAGVRKLSADGVVVERFGLVAGAIAPPHIEILRRHGLTHAFVDERLIQQERVDISSGHLHLGVHLPRQEVHHMLERLQFKVARITV